MWFAALNRTQPERVFMTYQNVDTIAVAGRHTVADQMVDGDVVMLNITATPTIPGKEMKLSTAAPVNIIGVVSSSVGINKNDFGAVQVYGLHNNVITDA